MATLSMQNNLSELDAMLMDLSKSKYAGGSDYGHTSSAISGFGDYSDYLDGPISIASGSHPAPDRPPPPSSYTPDSAVAYNKKKSKKKPVVNSTTNTLRSTSSGTEIKLPDALKPPKLQHVLVGEKVGRRRRRHDLVKAGPRDDDAMGAPADFQDDSDYGGPNSNYSTLKPPESLIPEASDDELDKVDAGQAPRGDASMGIKTEHGELKSKYRYLGFGLWENTEPADPKPPPKKPSPPPPPPKAEPIWYNCSVVVETHKTSKELDDLVHGLDGYDRMASKDVELGNAAANLPGCLGELWEPFEKEDMSEMFRRAFIEKMQLTEDPKPKHKCSVCREWINGRIITAMSHKFHPECFVCTYCRKEFKERSFKSDADLKPYCHECFEKLLGHFGSAQFKLKELTG